MPVKGCCALTTHFSVVTPFEQRKARDPHKFPCVLSIQLGFAEQQTQLAGDQRGGICAGNLFLGADAATTRSPGLASTPRRFFSASPRPDFFQREVTPSRPTFIVYMPRAPSPLAFSVISSSCLREYLAAPGAAKACTLPSMCNCVSRAAENVRSHRAAPCRTAGPAYRCRSGVSLPCIPCAGTGPRGDPATAQARTITFSITLKMLSCAEKTFPGRAA